MPIVTMSVVANWFFKRVGIAIGLMACTFFLMGIGMLAFCYAQELWIALLFLLLFSPGYGGGMVLRGATIREYFGRDSFGKLMGINMGTGAIGMVLGPTLAGWTFDTIGSYHPIWLVFCGLIGLAIGLILRIG